MIFRKPELTMATILTGCEAGRMQSVGSMQVVPLLSELTDHRFVSPLGAEVGTSGYGVVVLRNGTPRPVLVPAHAAWVVEEKAQDHALGTAEIVPAGRDAKFRDAMCVQQTQGGLIGVGRHRFAILPVALRRAAHASRSKDYSRLWKPIRDFREECGVPGAGNLTDFFRAFERQLDEFVAEFEMVPGQVGAIVLIGGRVVGVERAPSHAYWRDVWEPLIRECYGSHAIRETAVAGGGDASFRTPIRRKGLADLDDLEGALLIAEAEENERARATVRELIGLPFVARRESVCEEVGLYRVENDRLEGQIAREGERVLYASLVTSAKWERDRAWTAAEPFEI